MKKLMMAMAALLLAVVPARGADASGRPVIMLVGASFAVADNGWFELACSDLGAVPLNKAHSGEAIYHTARRMAAETLYSVEELDDVDLFVIDHVHDRNVADERNLCESWQDYSDVDKSTDYARAFDYVIKRYMADCAALRFNWKSKYYGATGGKPARIALCTHWHDGRTTYNAAVRRLAGRWHLALVEFDREIGFSSADAEAGHEQPSVAEAFDREVIDGVVYGWHPLRGSNRYVQRRMAQIFAGVAAGALGVEVPFECSLSPVSPMILPGEKALAALAFRGGQYPFEVACRGENAAMVASCPYLVGGEPDDAVGQVVFAVESVTDAEGRMASLPEPVAVDVAEYAITPLFDAYVHQMNPGSSYATSNVLQLKNGDGDARRIVLTFPIDGISPQVRRIVVRMFMSGYALGMSSDGSRRTDGVETVGIAANTSAYSGAVRWASIDSGDFEPLASGALTKDMHLNWVGWDVTDWVLGRVNDNERYASFLISMQPGWKMRASFVSADNVSLMHFAPQMLVGERCADGNAASAVHRAGGGLKVIGGRVLNPTAGALTVMSVSGRVCYSGYGTSVDMNAWPRGVYLIQCGGIVLKAVL